MKYFYIFILSSILLSENWIEIISDIESQKFYPGIEIDNAGNIHYLWKKSLLGKGLPNVLAKEILYYTQKMTNGNFRLENKEIVRLSSPYHFQHLRIIHPIDKKYVWISYQVSKEFAPFRVGPGKVLFVVLDSLGNVLQKIKKVVYGSYKPLQDKNGNLHLFTLENSPFANRYSYTHYILTVDGKELQKEFPSTTYKERVAGHGTIEHKGTIPLRTGNFDVIFISENKILFCGIISHTEDPEEFHRHKHEYRKKVMETMERIKKLSRKEIKKEIESIPKPSVTPPYRVVDSIMYFLIDTSGNLLSNGVKFIPFAEIEQLAVGKIVNIELSGKGQFLKNETGELFFLIPYVNPEYKTYAFKDAYILQFSKDGEIIPSKNAGMSVKINSINQLPLPHIPIINQTNNYNILLYLDKHLNFYHYAEQRGKRGQK